MVDKGFDVSPSTESSRQADGSAFVHATAGFISGSISSIVTNPLDIVKTRIQTQDVDRSVQHKSKGVLDELTRMLKVEGPKSVFRGMYVSLLLLQYFV
jgi:Mitochondrial carrier protein